MNILHVFDFMSPKKGGGTVDIISKLAKAQVKAGYNVTVCFGDFEFDAEYVRDLTDNGVVTQVFRSYYNKHGFYIILDIWKIDLSVYDVVHMHCYRSFVNLAITDSAVRSRVPYIIDAHGSTVKAKGFKRVAHYVYDNVFNGVLDKASLVVAETEVGVAEWRRLGAKSDKIRVLHPLIDVHEFDDLPPKGEFRRRYGIDDKFMVLFLGRLHKDKGIDVLIDVLSELQKDAVLVVAGGVSTYYPELLHQAIELNVFERVLFTEFLDKRNKLSALVDADVLVQPSKYEAGIRPSLEALLCGTPVIVSQNTGAGNELTRFNGGQLFDPEVNRSLFGAINAIRLGRQRSYPAPNALREQTRLAREYVREHYALDKQLGKYDKLYQEAINR